MKDYKFLVEHIKACLNQTIKEANNIVTTQIEKEAFLNGGKKLAEMLLQEIKEFENFDA